MGSFAQRFWFDIWIEQNSSSSEALPSFRKGKCNQSDLLVSNQHVCWVWVFCLLWQCFFCFYYPVWVSGVERADFKYQWYYIRFQSEMSCDAKYLQKNYPCQKKCLSCSFMQSWSCSLMDSHRLQDMEQYLARYCHWLAGNNTITILYLRQDTYTKQN